MKNFNIKVRLCKNINFNVIADDELSAINMVKDTLENNDILNINNSSNNIKTRYQCQMKDEVKKMRELGYWRIYDCGNKVWSFDR